MTNPTSNYGFVLPTASDLVTDLPADFDVALQGVDTRLKALNPETTLGDLSYGSATANTNTRLPIGTAGQVLTVSGGVPAWVAPNPGDIEGVTAGIGISGGGTSGTVTITNSMATAIDAKGDLVAGTGADAFSRLAVGANNTVLTADSAQATGMKWATPSPAAYIGASVTSNTNQTISGGVTAALNWNTENWDTDSFHDNATNNSRMTIPTGKSGKYLVSGVVTLENNGIILSIFTAVNGTKVPDGGSTAVGVSSGDAGASISMVLDLTAGQYVEIFARLNSTNVVRNYQSRFQITYLGA